MIPKASIIIPNWNGQHHLETCVSAIKNQTCSDYEIIIVDNGSVDGSIAYIREYFPSIILVELNENLGFTGACNAGYKIARGAFIILLNNDTEVDPEWLGQLLDAFDRHPFAGILASKLMLFDHRDTFHAAGDFYRLDAIPGNRGVWEKDTGQYSSEEQVFGACGAAAAYRRTMLEEIGFLDDRFYFSCEDMDMAWRAQLSGWRVFYVPTAVVYHKLKATGGSVTGSYYDGRNFWYLIWKHYPWSLLRKHWPAILNAQFHITWLAFKAWRGPAARARLRGQVTGFFGLFRMLKSRRQVQANRKITDDSLTDLMSPPGETPHGIG